MSKQKEQTENFSLPFREPKIHLKELTKFSEVVEAVDFVKYETGKAGSRPAGFRHARVTGAVDFNYFSVKLTPKVEQFIKTQMYMGDAPHEVFIEFLFYEEGHVLVLAKNNTILAERYLTILQAADVPKGNKPEVIGDKVQAVGGGKSKIPDSILKIISDMEQYHNVLKKCEKNLARADYKELDKVLTALGGKWTGGTTQGHRFDCTPDELTEKLDAVLTTGEYVNEKKALEAFYTPAALAERMAKLLDIKPGMMVLEPSAGEGALVQAVLKVQRNVDVVAVELSKEAVDKLKAATAGIKFSPGRYAKVFPSDFAILEIPVTTRFDRVIMNPPFQKACEHVTKAYGLLAEGGKLVAVMPSSILFREDKKYATLRALIEKTGTIEKLPEDSFKESGTGVSTVLVTMKK